MLYLKVWTRVSFLNSQTLLKIHNPYAIFKGVIVMHYIWKPRPYWKDHNSVQFSYFLFFISLFFVNFLFFFILFLIFFISVLLYIFLFLYSLYYFLFFVSVLFYSLFLYSLVLFFFYSLFLYSLYFSSLYKLFSIPYYNCAKLKVAGASHWNACALCAQYSNVTLIEIHTHCHLNRLCAQDITQAKGGRSYTQLDELYWCLNSFLAVSN